MLVAPFKDRSKRDERDLFDAKRELLKRGWLPIFLPDSLGDVLNDHNPTDRATALAVSAFFCRILAEVPEVEMVVVGEQMSEGMHSDVSAWLDAGGPAPMNFEELAVLSPPTEEDGDGRDD